MSIIFYSNDPASETIRTALQKALPGLSVNRPEELDEQARSAVRFAVAWNPPEDFFNGLNKLEAIFSMGAGVDHLLNHPSLPAGVPIARLEDAGMADKIAEYVLYGVLHAQRSFDIYREKQALAEWDSIDRDRHAIDTRTGILGVGVIGKVVAQRLASNGYTVAGWSRSPKTIAGVEMYTGNAELAGFLSKLDVLVCLLPLTSETRNTINAELIAQLPPGAYLINAARGKHVDQQALLDALQSGHLRGALLDVTEPEPLPQDHPLWQHPNVLITPHVAGPTQLTETIEQIAANLNRAVAGDELSGLVLRERGY